MQQAAKRVEPVPSGAGDGDTVAGAVRDTFVINLISSTTPVALTRPDHAGLRRFTFFVSRRREEGRERFRLHMGYFQSQEDAEKLLDIVREIYPGAWAGLAPGRNLRGAALRSASVAAVSEAPAAATAPTAERPVDLAPSVDRTAAVVAAPLPTPIIGSASAPAASAQQSMPLSRAAVDAVVPNKTSLPARPAAGVAPIERQAAVRSLSSVRAAIAQLDDRVVAPSAPAPTPASASASVPAPARPADAPIPPVVDSIPTCAPLSPTRVEPPTVRMPTVSTPPAADPAAVAGGLAQPIQPARGLNDRAVLKLLEGSTSPTAKSPATATQDEKPCYAVQLIWSVKPIDIQRIPPLAIFSAYTLYGAQGHREGRRWYGVRLGFFTDAISAKQVAQYVRADFATVSIVPVSGRERDQARRAMSGTGQVSAAAKSPDAAPKSSKSASGPTVSLEEFKFVDDASMPDEIKLPKKGRPGAQAAPTTRSGRGAPGKRAVFRPGRAHAQRKLKSLSLEETLEILGANTLEVEPPSRVSSVEEGGDVRAAAAAVAGKPSRLSRLFERLSERLGS